MIMTTTNDNWLELELVRGINDQSLQKRLLQERDPMLRDMISGNLNYTRDQKEKEENTQIHKMNGNKQGKANSPTDTSTSGEDGNVLQADSNHTSRKPFDRRPKMHNVKITPVTSGYQLKFIQFSSDVYPDTGCTETVIAASMTKRQRLSDCLRDASGRQPARPRLMLSTKDRWQGWRL